MHTSNYNKNSIHICIVILGLYFIQYVNLYIQELLFKGISPTYMASFFCREKPKHCKTLSQIYVLVKRQDNRQQF